MRIQGPCCASNPPTGRRHRVDQTGGAAARSYFGSGLASGAFGPTSPSVRGRVLPGTSSAGAADGGAGEAASPAGPAPGAAGEAAGEAAGAGAAAGSSCRNLPPDCGRITESDRLLTMNTKARIVVMR